MKMARFRYVCWEKVLIEDSVKIRMTTIMIAHLRRSYTERPVWQRPQFTVWRHFRHGRAL